MRLELCTGDNATTGSAIARQCGILPMGGSVVQPKGQAQLMEALESQREEVLVLDGPDFRRAVLDADGNLRQPVFDRMWPRLRVLARCSPADKYTIVKGDTDGALSWLVFQFIS